MKTFDLKGAWLDYWTAVADDVPRNLLEIRQIPRTDNFICVRLAHNSGHVQDTPICALHYSTNWALTGPLLKKFACALEIGGMGSENVWVNVFIGGRDGGQKWEYWHGMELQDAICKAAVMIKCGPVVCDVPVSEN